MFVASKRGYLFSLDAFLAITIVFSSLAIVYLSFTATPSTESDAQLSQDALISLENLRVFSVNTDEILKLRLQSNQRIVSSQITLLEQLGYFYYEGDCGQERATVNVCDSTAPPDAFICDCELAPVAKSVMDSLIPVQFSYALLLEDKVIAERGQVPLQGSDISVSRSYAFGRNPDTAAATPFWGPYAVEVRVWR